MMGNRFRQFSLRRLTWFIFKKKSQTPKLSDHLSVGHFQGTRLTVHFQSQNITKMSIQGLGLHLVTFTVLSKP